MPNERCEQAMRDFDSALYDKNYEQLDRKIRDALTKRNVALAIMAASPLMLAAVFSDSEIVLGLGLLAGGAAFYFAYRSYQEALSELATFRARCEQLMAQANDALQRVCRYCREPDYDPEECNRRRAELAAEAPCG